MSPIRLSRVKECKHSFDASAILNVSSRMNDGDKAKDKLDQTHDMASRH